jgi:excisionase family DNA binding protein
VRALIKDIVADVDEEEAREAILVVHWRGGHIRNCGSKNPTCGHDCQTPGEPLAVMRSMAGRWDDDHIAASLNRMGMRTGHGKSWNAERAGSLRRVHDIHAYRSADKNDEWLTMSEAATKLGVTHHVIRRLIPDRILAAEQVVPGAPYQIKASDLRDNRVAAALLRRTRPCQADRQTDFQCFPMLEEGRW